MLGHILTAIIAREIGESLNAVYPPAVGGLIKILGGLSHLQIAIGRRIPSASGARGGIIHCVLLHLGNAEALEIAFLQRLHRLSDYLLRAGRLHRVTDKAAEEDDRD